MRRFIAAPAFAVAVAAATSAFAGPASEALGKCVADSSSRADRMLFVRWFVAALSADPDVRSGAPAAPEVRERLTRETADIVQRLVTTDCREQAVAALREDGLSAVASASETFGRSMAAELVSNPAVARAVYQLAAQMDQSQLETLLEDSRQR
ncbi:MAG TPA: hypothetical protein VKT30_18990 [Caulobacteraceae bacterium]|nr:hypothetical protein [Caulobacteraceae bacterium]